MALVLHISLILPISLSAHILISSLIIINTYQFLAKNPAKLKRSIRAASVTRFCLLLVLAECSFLSSSVSVCAVVPGPVPREFVRATPSEDKISLRWKEPLEPNGIITQYEVMLRASVSSQFLCVRFECLCAKLEY